MASNIFKYDIEAYQGDSINGLEFAYQKLSDPSNPSSAKIPFDFTGASGLMQVRDDYAGNVVLELSTTNGGLVLDELSGKVILHATSEQMDLVPPGDNVYDIQLTFTNGVVRTFQAGYFRVTPQVSK